MKKLIILLITFASYYSTIAQQNFFISTGSGVFMGNEDKLNSFNFEIGYHFKNEFDISLYSNYNKNFKTNDQCFVNGLHLTYNPKKLFFLPIFGFSYYKYTGIDKSGLNLDIGTDIFISKNDNISFGIKFISSNDLQNEFSMLSIAPFVYIKL